MFFPHFWPPPSYRFGLELPDARPLSAWCREADLPCRASGAWTERPVAVRPGAELRILASPGDDGAVLIEAPAMLLRQPARLALLALAYGLHDGVARASVCGVDWARPTPTPGRPRGPRPLSVAERQAGFRRRRKVRDAG